MNHSPVNKVKKVHKKKKKKNEESNGKDEFERALLYVKNGPPLSTTAEQKLQFYALFKQISSGPCNTTRPGMLDPIGKAKWDAWNNLGKITTEEAKKKYVSTLDQLAPNWRTWKAQIKSKL